jgi:hypothetical protein
MMGPRSRGRVSCRLALNSIKRTAFDAETIFRGYSTAAHIRFGKYPPLSARGMGKR